jgi:hypothetical protein
MTQRPQYKFLRPYPPHNIGDPVPDTYGAGMIQTMLDYKRIVRVAEPYAPVSDPAKALTESPADKMVRMERVKRKGVA